MKLGEKPGELVYSVVIPLFNESSNIEVLYTRLKRTLKELKLPYEIIFVDDGSTDESYQILRKIASTDSSVQVVKFIRNFGQHFAVTAGILEARGQYIITLDADLQNPPEEIPKLVKKIKEGYDMISGYRKRRSDSVLRKVPSWGVNILIWVKTGVKMKDYGSMLRIFTRETALRVASEFQKTTGYISMLIPKVTRNVAEVEVRHNSRYSGESRYNFRKLALFVWKILLYPPKGGKRKTPPTSLFIIERKIVDGEEKIIAG